MSNSLLILLAKNDNEFNTWAGVNEKILDDKIWGNYSILQGKIFAFSSEGTEDTYNDFIKQIINISIKNNSDKQAVLAIHFGEGKIESDSDEITRVKCIVNEMSLKNKVEIVPYSLGSNEGKGSPEGINTIYENIKNENDQNTRDEQYKKLLDIFNIASEQTEKNNRISEFENLQLYIQSLSLMLKVFQKSSKISKSLLDEIKSVLPQLKKQNINKDTIANLNDKLQEGKLFSETDFDSMISDCKVITDNLEKEKNRIRDKNDTPEA